MSPFRSHRVASMARVPALVLASAVLVSGIAGAQGATPAEATDGGTGPVLELEGLEDPAAAAQQPQSSGPAGEGEAQFEERIDPGATLAERAAAIVDRTVIGGYAEHDLVIPRNGISTFRNHRYVIFVYSNISERISTATEVEFEFAGSPVKRDGQLGFGEALLEFSVIDVRLYDALTLRAGVILVPVGTYNIHHDAPAQELPERPIAYTTVVPTTWFESGAGALGQFSLGDVRFGYELYAINGLDAKILDGQGLRAARGSNLQDNNNDKAITGRFTVSPLLGLELGASGYTGAYDREGRRVNLVNADAFWRVGPFDFTGEVVRVFIDPGFVQGFNEGSVSNTRDRVPEGMFGFYAQTNYRFRIEPLFRAMPAGWRDGHFTASLRYEEKDTDRQFVTAGDEARLTVGLNFRPLPPFVFKNSFYFQKSGAAGIEQPHVWNGSFWKENDWAYVGSVAWLF